MKIALRTLLVALAACLFVSLMLAQSTAPQYYTLTVSSSMALEALSFNSAVEAKVSRFGPREFAEELAAFNKNVVRRENINGIAVKYAESTSDQGKSSIWAAENGNYPVKVVMTFPGAQPMLMLEVKELHFVKQDNALLNPPYRPGWSL